MNIYPKGSLVILMGSFPPPIGGVSIYLSRLKNQLHENSIDLFCWDITNSSFDFYKTLISIILKKRPQNTIFHSHSVYSKHILILILLSYIKPFKFYLTNHNLWAIDKKQKIRAFLLNWANKRIHNLFYVNPLTLDKYDSQGIFHCKNSMQVSPFIPPKQSDAPIIVKSYPKSLMTFIAKRKPLLLANAHKIVFHDGTELYGLDMCVSLLIELSKRHPNVGLIFALADDSDHNAYLNDLMEKLQEKDAQDNFYLLTPQKTMWPLFSMIDIFLRPTTTDGMAVSIDEALFFNAHVVASDLTYRQTGCHLFKNRNQDHFNSTVEQLLKDQILV